MYMPKNMGAIYQIGSMLKGLQSSFITTKNAKRKSIGRDVKASEMLIALLRGG